MNDFYKQKLIAQRSPILNKDEYYKYFIEKKEFTYEDMEKLFENSVIREGILFASPDLYFSIKNKSGDCEKTLYSFVKYFIRMTTRATPFGLFSGIHFNKEYVEDKNLNIKHVCTVDFEWLITLLNHLELNLDILYGLKIKSNQNLVIEKHTCTNPYISLRYENKEYFDNINVEQHVLSIENTQMVQYILNKCTDFVVFLDLLNDIREQVHDKIPPYKIVNFLVELINREFLYTNLRPSLPLIEPLHETIETLKEIDTADIYVHKLRKINQLIDLYNNTELGDGEEILISLIEYMKKLQKSKKYIHIDMRLDDIDIGSVEQYIPKVNDDFFKTSNYLSYALNKNDVLEEYTYKFIEKYGFERKVPLLEVIDMQKGIGYPEYNKNRQNILNSNEEKIKYILNNLILKSIHDGKNHINLTLEELKKLELEIIQTSVGSFDLSFNKKNEFELSPLMGISPSGRIIGRFTELAKLNDNYINTFINDFGTSNKNILEAELMLMPSDFRCGNVISKHTINQNLIALGSYSKKQLIKIQDIYVGIDQRKKMYLYYHGKVLKVRISNMLNPKLCPEIYRVILDISEQNSIINSLAYMHSFIENYNYVPQIKIENIGIFPETWIINKLILGMTKKSNFFDFLTLFKNYSSEFNIPEYFYLKDYDNTLLLCKSNITHMKILYLEIIKKNQTFIHLTSGSNKFDEIGVDEIIVTYEPNHIETVKPILLGIPPERIEWFERNKQLNSDWIYIKIYAKKIVLKKIIVTELKKYGYDYIDKGYIDKFFYINYMDDRKHLRIRFHSITNCVNMISEINNFIRNIEDKYDIYNIKFDTYEREIERYGGISLIELNETMFYLNTIISIELLEKVSKNNIFSLEEMAILEIIYFIKLLEIKTQDVEKMFDFIDNKDRIKEFRNHKDKYINMFLLLESEKSKFDTDCCKEIMDILHKQDNIIKKYRKCIFSLKLTNSIDEIILAHLHMFCNRFFGVDRNSELKCYAMVKHLFHAIEGYKKYNDKYK